MRGARRPRLAALLAIPVAAAALPAVAAEAPPGASACTGCHASAKLADSALPRIVGRPAADIAASLRGFRSGAVPSTVMGRIAKGFDDTQIEAIAVWFAAQPE
ncbi:MAG: cytochrome C [Reyranellaceae bacterium]